MGIAGLAALLLVLGLASALIPGCYRDNWTWESPSQAILGALGATAATVANPSAHPSAAYCLIASHRELTMMYRSSSTSLPQYMGSDRSRTFTS